VGYKGDGGHHVNCDQFIPLPSPFQLKMFADNPNWRKQTHCKGCNSQRHNRVRLANEAVAAAAASAIASDADRVQIELDAAASALRAVAQAKVQRESGAKASAAAVVQANKIQRETEDARVAAAAAAQRPAAARALSAADAAVATAKVRQERATASAISDKAARHKKKPAQVAASSVAAAGRGRAPKATDQARHQHDDKARILQRWFRFVVQTRRAMVTLDSTAVRVSAAYPGSRTAAIFHSREHFAFTKMVIVPFSDSSGLHNIKFYELADGTGWVHDFTPGGGARNITKICRVFLRHNGSRKNTDLK
jgi:hypothetical protein